MPIVDLRGLPTLRQIEEYDFRAERGEQYPRIAVRCLFKLSDAARYVINHRPSWYLAA